jgi:FMN phosphatase YigB (HAD superfamily)
MKSSRIRTLLLTALLSGALAVSPAATWQPPADPAPLADARYKAALKEFNQTWSYYQQARIDSYQVYVWSRLLLECQLDLSPKPPERLAAFDDHLTRMKKLEQLIKKIRKLGFERSYDVGAAEYYRIEGQYWLTREKSKK